MSTEEEKFRLLFVDDEADILDSLRRSFRRDYEVFTANSGTQGIELLKSEQFDLIISDQRMPDVMGDAVLKFAMEHQPKAIRILLTGYSDMESLVRCVNEAGLYKYITKPWEPENLRLTVMRALESLSLERKLDTASRQLKQAYLDAVTMLSVACEGKDEDTGFHVRRVQHYTEALALELGVPAQEAEHMGVMSILHDIGKLYIPDSILKKPAKLDDEEFKIMRRHPEFGVRILGDNPFYEMAREIAACHHENVDGSGYPKGLAGEQIPLSARIAKAADVFDALTSKRPYKEPWSIEQALAMMDEQSGRQFDGVVVQGLHRLHANGTILRIMQEYHAHEVPQAGVPVFAA
ncbi:putative two-component system response regulator [Novimethylophilus kurashikiensis]|uniref:Putative two-component system response regulator n=1 Tax=Novimethylophilus kurashikiensis TaxID=1825523 RepID=A0A2R5FDE0_9PROT|nr:HD domain-containing phosphohydrolase [Novimethylophilus kurashikiensis]GBG14661.1 putative two-component system response regulator [Novimethylophilus kurashikiensis]